MSTLDLLLIFGLPILLLIGVPIALALLVLLARYRDRVPGVPKLLEQPPEDDPVQGAVLWSAWRGHLSPQSAYRAQVLKLVRLGAVEMRADGQVTDPQDLTLVRKVDALDLQSEIDQDFIWLLFGPAAARRIVHGALLVAVALALPLNVETGHEWRDWYTSGMRAVERDIAAGATRDELVARHGDFLLHWDDDLLARNIDRLREEKVGPFGRVPPSREPR